MDKNDITSGRKENLRLYVVKPSNYVPIVYPNPWVKAECVYVLELSRAKHQYSLGNISEEQVEWLGLKLEFLHKRYQEFL